MLPNCPGRNYFIVHNRKQSSIPFSHTQDTKTAPHLLLIQAPYLDDYGPMRKAAGTYFPLGLGYIAAMVEQDGHQVDLLDPNVQEVPIAEIAARVAASPPLLVGISFMTPQFFRVKEICQRIKEAALQVPIILGGAHPSVMPEETLLGIPEADYAVAGEGEEIMRRIMRALVNGHPIPEDIDGLARRRDGEVVFHGPRQSIANLDTLPFPDRSLIDQSLYNPQSFLSHFSRLGTIYTSRGCPGRCVFCASGYGIRSVVRERSMDNIIAEIDMLRANYNIEYLIIKDDTFTMRRKRVQEFCAALSKRHPGLKWHCMGRVNTVDYDLLVTMKKAGLNDIFFGIESGNDQILKKAQKGITTARARQAVEDCARAGVKTYGAFILGLPGDNPETIEQTICFACSLPLTMAGFSILIPYPGTKVYADYYRSDSDDTDKFNDFIASTGVHFVSAYSGLEGMEVKDLPQWVSQAQRRFYLRPAQIFRMLRNAGPAMLAGYAKGFGALLTKSRYLKRTV